MLSLSNKRILIVDDQKPFLVMLRGLVNALGGTSVVSVQNGESAIVACRKEKFDFIISDLHLGPEKKSGLQLLEEVRVRKLVKPETVFVVVSADNDRHMVLGGIEMQPDDYVIKPFSQAQLSQRLHKAYIKKQKLKPIFAHLMKDDLPGAIDACRTQIKEGSPYRQYLTMVLADLYWRNENYDAAAHMLQQVLKIKPTDWATLALAKTKLLQNHYDESLELSQSISSHKLHNAEAHDISAQCYMGLEQAPKALDTIQKSLAISPYSLSRQFIAADIARACEDYELVRQACKAIFELSKKSVHRDINHLCTYIRSILDAAEHAEEKSQRNRYQQEAMLSLQRLKNDDLVLRTTQPFDFGVFEDLIEARISFLDGHLMDSKRALTQTQYKLKQKFDEYPIALAPDSMKVMFDLGEFEEAGKLVKLLRSSQGELDKSLQYLIQTSIENSRNTKKAYTELNKSGIQHYSEGKYQSAYEAFIEAQKLVPVNTGVALNLLQCLVKMLEAMEQPAYELVTQVRQNFRLVKDINLPESHQRKLDSLKDDISPYLHK